MNAIKSSRVFEIQMVFLDKLTNIVRDKCEGKEGRCRTKR